MTTTRLKLAAAVLLAAGIAVWLLVDKLGSEGKPHPLPWRDLTAQTGPLVLPREITREFISRPQLAAYLHFRGGRRVPEIDFPGWRGLLISLGPRSSSAYSVRVLGVAEERDRVVVSVHRRNATLANPGRPRLTFPYRLITLPTTGKPIHLHWVR